MIDWPLLAAFPGTLVLYMGVRRLPEIAAALMAGGRAASEPVAVVESGTIPGQRTVPARSRRSRRPSSEPGPPAVDDDRRPRRRARRRARLAALCPCRAAPSP